jgi:hypothetical protein
LLADGVHDFPEQLLITDSLGGLDIAGAFNDLAPETFDLVRRQVTEVVVERLAGFQLLAVDQKVRGRPSGLPYSS